MVSGADLFTVSLVYRIGMVAIAASALPKQTNKQARLIAVSLRAGFLGPR